jgi:RNA polymerase sigma factor (sigma-70 family)
MLAPALRFEEPNFRDAIAKYVTATCRRYRVRRVEVEDIVQEALTQIVASVDTFRPEKGEFDKWARGVALNVIRMHTRDAKRYGDRFSQYHPNVDDHAAPEPSPERCAQRMQARCSLLNAAKQLSTKQVQVLALHVLDALSHGDIGDELGISEAASQKCYQRTRNKLALCVQEDLLSIMPPFVSGCDEPISSKHGSRWPERSHYAGQFAAIIGALLCVAMIPGMDQQNAKAGVHSYAQKIVMYRYDKQANVSDEPAVHRDEPEGKQEATNLTSVSAVSTPTRAVDKPSPLRLYAPLPPHKHTVRPSVHRPRGR